LVFEICNLETMDKEEKRKILIELMKKMKEDDSLPLKAGSTNLVFGEGNVDTKVLFIGEGPGFYEDQQALPFVGRAGQLLNELLTSIGLNRKEVFITNVVHHRPPQNRDPLPQEMAAYQPYLDKIIEVIDPKVIVTLGRFSMGKFLPGVTITRVHGKPEARNWNGRDITIVPMYHPAAALRNGSIKTQLALDFKVIKDVLKKVEDKEREAEEEKKKPQQESLI
jgi:uracil-DNA glycosylase